MKKLVLIVTLVLLVAAVGCSWMHHVISVPLRLIRAVDAQVETWCAEGWLPPPVCERYGEVREAAVEKWDEAKTDFLNWVERFLRGEFGPPTAGTPPDTHTSEIPPFPVFPDAEGILDAASLDAQDGSLTPEELSRLMDAAEAAEGG